MTLQYNRTSRDRFRKGGGHVGVPEFSAAVLTGGESRRMGRDKALIPLCGRTVLERIIRVLGQVTSDIMVVGDRAEYHAFGVPVIADDAPGMGPLGGIATALRRARNGLVFITACDMPLLDGAVIQAMATDYAGQDALVFSRDRGEQRAAYEPMHAFYSVRSLAVIEDQLANGRLRLEDTLNRLDLRVLPEAWLLVRDPGQDTLFNMNRPEDISHAEDRLRLREGCSIGE